MTQEITPDRPLVTFALFAYNQEKYIREAVEGAFSQTYEPLEIILSDDCSSDRTFEIMQEMAAAYKGPHEVRVRQSEVNFGTALHVQAIANAMSGELMVVAAGDDVSVSERCAEIVRAWVGEGKSHYVVHSELISFLEEDPSKTRLVKLRNAPDKQLGLDWYAKNNRTALLPPTAAYAKKIFTEFPNLIGGSIIEDGPLSLRGNIKSSFLAVQKPLVVKKIVQESAGSGYNLSNVKRWNRFVRSRMISNFTQIQDLGSGGVHRSMAKRLERRKVRIIRKLSLFVLPEHGSLSIVAKTALFIKLLLFYPISYSLWGRLHFALHFVEVLNHDREKKLRNLLRVDMDK